MGERNVFAQAGNCWAHELGTRLLRKQAEAGRQQGCGPEGGKEEGSGQECRPRSHSGQVCQSCSSVSGAPFPPQLDLAWSCLSFPKPKPTVCIPHTVTSPVPAVLVQAQAVSETEGCKAC